MKLQRNTMNSISAIILGSSIMLLTPTVNAQRSQEQGPPKINHQQVISQLNLDAATDEQSLLALMNKHRSQHNEQRYEDHKNNRDQREQHRADVKALLGEEKFTAFEKAMWEQRQNQPPRPKPGVRKE